MDMEKRGAVRMGEFCQPGKVFPTLPRQRMDEAESDSRRSEVCIPVRQSLKDAGRAAALVVQVPRPIDALGQDRDEIMQCFETRRIQQCSVCRHTGFQTERRCPPQSIHKSRVDQRLAAGERHGAVAHVSGVLDELTDPPIEIAPVAEGPDSE